MHNQENPVTFEQAKRELNCSDYTLSALRNRLGIRGRIFMLSPIREFLLTDEGKTFSAFGHYREHSKKRRLTYEEVDGKWVVTAPNLPAVMAQDRSLAKAIAQAGKQLEALV